MSLDTDDLEQTLMLAAAAADSRQYEESEDQPPSSSSEKDSFRYYTEADDTEKDEREDPDESQLQSSVNVPSANEKATPTDEDTDEQDSPSESERRGQQEELPELGRKTHNKRRKEDPEATGHAHVVATHYNLIEEKGLDERMKSRIVYMRNFHNWVKSMLINEYLTKIKDAKRQHNPPIRVHDMCCGKGGDLQKWKKGNITSLVCSDIAEVSLEHCKQRYSDMKHRTQNERGWGSNSLFSMEVIHADVGKVRLREKYSDPSMKFDLVSCQLAFAYFFESLQKAECLLKNAAECLQPGGYFIGSMPDSNEIVARARKSSSGSFGNEVYQVNIDFDLSNPPLFGGKYHFHLDGVVDCPEFLVHFPTFVKLAKRHGLKLVQKEKFWQLFERMKDEGKQLLNNMRALEGYPPNEGVTLVGSAPDDYNHAKKFVAREGKPHAKVGTLSKSEWEASSLYLTFAFEKVKNTWNADGTPCYDI